MATPFSSIDATHAVGRHGTIARNFPFKVESYRAEADIPNGRAVKQGATADECKLGVNAAAADPFGITSFLGISTDNPTLEAGDADETPQHRRVDVLVEGDIWLIVATAVGVGDDVTVKKADGTLASAAGSATVGVGVKGRWMTAAAANGLARLRLFGEQI